MGSVKDLKIIKHATPDELGKAQFFFSDRYSVFDWGEMPDHIENKGVALCLKSAYCFEKAEENGINTHYRGLGRSDGKRVRLNQIEEPTNIMEISLARVVHPQYVNGAYDYSMYTANLANFLIPLEIIYRNGLPEGSSTVKRLETGEVQLDDLGLDHYPNPREVLEKPLVDVSTKLEERDRYVTWREAKKLPV